MHCFEAKKSVDPTAPLIASAVLATIEECRQWCRNVTNCVQAAFSDFERASDVGTCYLHEGPIGMVDSTDHDYIHGHCCKNNFCNTTILSH